MASISPMAFQQQTRILCHSLLLSSLNADDRKTLSTILPVIGDLSCMPKANDIVQCLLRLVGEFDQRFARSFELDPVVHDLGLDKSVDSVELEKSFLNVIEGLFEKTNWGRIIAMFAFLRMLVIRLVKTNQLFVINSLVDTTCKYADENLKNWILMHNGWAGLLDFEGVQSFDNTEEFVWRALKGFGGLATGAVGALGIVALAAFIANKI